MKKTTLKDIVKAAHKAGAKVSFSMEPHAMPRQLPNDPYAVIALIEESRRMNKLAKDWETAEHPNPIASSTAYANGWAFALSAAWLRCKIKGEFDQNKKP